jgi:hypothetical protein
MVDHRAPGMEIAAEVLDLPCPACSSTKSHWKGLGKERMAWGTLPAPDFSGRWMYRWFCCENGGCDWVVVLVTAGELWRLMDDGGGRCGVERPLLCTHFILKGWCCYDDSSNGSGRRRGE